MLTVKKCAVCVSNSFKVIYDSSTVSIICEHCGQTYPIGSLKRLPDDQDATSKIKITVMPELRRIVHV